VRQIPKVHQIPSARQIPRTHRIPKVRQIPSARQIPKVHQIPSARRAVAVLVLLAGWLAAAVCTARPASAHAELASADPPDGSRLASPPGRVTLTFSESVSLGVGFVRVVDQSGHEVDAGPAEHPAGAGEAVAVRLRPRLPNGGYLVSYQVVSADSHPISGAVAFTVGNGPLLDASGAVLEGTGTDPVLGLVLTVTRWVSYAGLALLGGLVFLPACWPARRPHP